MINPRSPLPIESKAVLALGLDCSTLQDEEPDPELAAGDGYEKDEPLKVRAVAWNDDGSRLALTTCGVVGDDLNDDQGGGLWLWPQALNLLVDLLPSHCVCALLRLPVPSLPLAALSACLSRGHSCLPGRRPLVRR